ncbi:MAG TPA: PDZ domain-containing protein [Verrucomicrobiota bacterium]|nr:PDZ domain-containing protein [Verrucomicrobiota bacterium]HRT10041.1 PDZ domain-containing protein [Candidatus Paceibacterota bacterium]HRT55583.1 PDZ domain-containing protein [Candidatus Paceibacterota bacterium]
MTKRAFFAIALAGALLSPRAGTWAQETVNTTPDARMLRYPDVSATHIVFVYAGDIWVVPKTGGQAQRLSSPRGEETFPRFSPDGSQIAFSGNYDGNTDIYVVPVTGGLPRRLTYHGGLDRMLEWYPDGRKLLFASSRTSEKDRFNQLYSISVEGGLPEKLPVPYGEFGAISPDGRTLAYVPITVDFATWKRYRGGMNPAIWLFDLKTFAARNLTGNQAGNSQPMWHGSTLYFVSDRDKNKRANLWAYDLKKKNFRQITTFEEFDVHFPSIGPEDIVFENGARLYLLNLATEKLTEVSVQVLTDRATLKPRTENVASLARDPDISPSAKRVVFTARGELFTVPAEHGVIRNLTRSSGVAERYPVWSPDGKTIAYFSDRTGEYELTVRPADGSGAEEVLTRLGPGFRYRPSWSPDSKKIMFVDQAMRIHLHDLEKKETTEVARQLWHYHDALARMRFAWSRDSRWVAFAKDLDNLHTAIVIYDTRERKLHQVTSGYYDDDNPVFDPDGKYLYYRSGRSFSPLYSDLDNTWVYPNTHLLMAVSLRKDVPSPLAPRNDEEPAKDKPAKDPDKKPPADDSDAKPEDAAKPEAGADAKEKSEAKDESKEAKPETKTEKKPEKEPKALEIDLAGLEDRAVVLPAKAGRYDDLIAGSGKLLYRRLPRAGAAEERSTLVLYDLEKREEKTVLDDVDDVIPTAKGDKLLVRRKGEYCIIEPKEGQKFEKKLNLAGLETVVDPVAEWEQLFTEAWRLERDYFYDPNLHGVDWNLMRERYSSLLKDAVTRWDVNYLIGELIGELNSSHTYRSGGDVENPPQRPVGYLGVDYALENGAYRIKKIIETASWDAEQRSPLKAPGVNVKEGDYLLAVNGQPLDISQEPHAAFQGLADKPVILTVNDKPSPDGAREVLVQTLSSEYRLRHLAWIESNRKRVEEATGGKVGYVYVPDTGRGGQSELVRQFRAQFNKAGLIIDERFNSGGQIPDRFVELLARKTLNYWGVRDGADWAWPQVAHSGPKAMLINGWSGSGGDCFPFYFKKAKLGPLVGTRTWGGLIGMTGNPLLIDDGRVTVPTFGIYDTNGNWIIEGHGVDPDVPVVDHPGLMAKGRDPQLERAITEVMKALKRNPPTEVKKPQYPVRAGR